MKRQPFVTWIRSIGAHTGLSPDLDPLLLGADRVIEEPVIPAEKDDRAADLCDAERVYRLRGIPQQEPDEDHRADQNVERVEHHLQLHEAEHLGDESGRLGDRLDDARQHDAHAPEPVLRVEVLSHVRQQVQPDVEARQREQQANDHSEKRNALAD